MTLFFFKFLYLCKIRLYLDGTALSRGALNPTTPSPLRHTNFNLHFHAVFVLSTPLSIHKPLVLLLLSSDTYASAATNCPRVCLLFRSHPHSSPAQAAPSPLLPQRASPFTPCLPHCKRPVCVPDAATLLVPPRRPFSSSVFGTGKVAGRWYIYIMLSSPPTKTR